MHGSYYLSPTKMVKFCNETFAMHILFKIHKPELSEISPERQNPTSYPHTPSTHMYLSPEHRNRTPQRIIRVFCDSHLLFWWEYKSKTTNFMHKTSFLGVFWQDCRCKAIVWWLVEELSRLLWMTRQQDSGNKIPTKRELCKSQPKEQDPTN